MSKKSNIKNIIFDFGQVFISLNVAATKRRFAVHGILGTPKDLESVFHDFERGKVTPEQFLNAIRSRAWWGSNSQFQRNWEGLIGDFPEPKLNMLESLSTNYRTFLLSNINEIHEHHIRRKLGETFFNRFWNSFEAAYYSHHIGMRKPDREAFDFVLNQNNLVAEETLFIDDTWENIYSAKKLGIKTWHLTPDQNLLDLPKRLTTY